MGFDLYGMSPQINKKYPPRYEEILKEYREDQLKYNCIDNSSDDSDS